MVAFVSVMVVLAAIRIGAEFQRMRSIKKDFSGEEHGAAKRVGKFLGRLIGTALTDGAIAAWGIYLIYERFAQCP